MSLNITPGSPTADSYVSEASANSYFQYKENAKAWNGMIANQGTGTASSRKEDLLKQATRELDHSFRFHSSKFYDGIVGQGQDEYQSLEFPRRENQDADDNLIIPDEIKFGAYEQALWILQRGGLKTNPETGAVFVGKIIGTRTKDFIKGWVNRQIAFTGKWPWQGSDY